MRLLLKDSTNYILRRFEEKSADRVYQVLRITVELPYVIYNCREREAVAVGVIQALTEEERDDTLNVPTQGAWYMPAKSVDPNSIHRRQMM